jgi:hypothetical protein
MSQLQGIIAAPTATGAVNRIELQPIKWRARKAECRRDESTQACKVMMPSCAFSKARRHPHKTPNQDRHENMIKDSTCCQSGWYIFSDEAMNFMHKEGFVSEEACQSRFPRDKS